MDFTLIELEAYHELRNTVILLSERIISLAQRSVQQTADRWLTADEVCKALHLSKRALHYYRQQRQIPYTMLEKKIYYRESDIHKILVSNQILPKKR